MIPKFSIRQLLWLMVAIGLLSLCMSSAARGSRVAFGISVAVIGAVLPLMVYAVVQWLSFGVANLWKLRGNRTLKTPVDQPVVAGAGVAADSAAPNEPIQDETIVADGGEDV